MRVKTVQPSRSSRSTPSSAYLRNFSKLICWATLLLIFVGGMVTSTGSGLAVPDWPLSYGMIFPPMVGGVFYEHGHRMVATTVGFLMLCMAISVAIIEKRRWVKAVAFTALGAVIAQGILGGITVLFFLPTPVSVAHGILAQTFFVLTIVLAYSQSVERREREKNLAEIVSPSFLKAALIFLILVYFQLAAGAVMRHTGSGLAVPDFPKMGGEWWPSLTPRMLRRINDWRFAMNLEPVTRAQVIYHLVHRMGAVILLTVLAILNFIGLRIFSKGGLVYPTIILLDIALCLQIILGSLTVLTGKEPLLTSFHVMTGAGILGLTILLILRASPLSFTELKKTIVKNV